MKRCCRENTISESVFPPKTTTSVFWKTFSWGMDRYIPKDGFCMKISSSDEYEFHVATKNERDGTSIMRGPSKILIFVNFPPSTNPGRLKTQSHFQNPSRLIPRKSPSPYMSMFGGAYGDARMPNWPH